MASQEVRQTMETVMASREVQEAIADEIHEREAEHHDASNLIDWIERTPGIYISHSDLLSAGGDGFTVQHCGRNRLYGAETFREAVSKAILDLDGYIPAHTMTTLMVEPQTLPMSEVEAKRKGFI